MASTLDLTIQVSNLSPKVTLADLNTFFSYCGTVADIQLDRKQDQSQSALVSFKQPFAFKTALLLNDAVIADSRIRILPLHNETSQSISEDTNYQPQKNNEKQCPVLMTVSLVQAVASKGHRTLNKAREEWNRKLKGSENQLTVVPVERENHQTAVPVERRTGNLIRQVREQCFPNGTRGQSVPAQEETVIAGRMGSTQTAGSRNEYTAVPWI